MRNPTRRRVLTGAAGLAAVGCTGDREPSDRDRTRPTGDTGSVTPTGDTGRRGPPNLVYVYVDQLRWDALASTGNPIGVTPNIDAFAREAVKFTTCITNAPSCRAARTTMMTGLHVFAHGIWQNKMLPDPSLQSHVRRLRDEAGYHAMVIGKTHLHDGRGHFDDHKDKLVAWGFTDSIELPDPQQWDYESAYSDWLTATTPKGDVDKYRRWQDYVQSYQWDSPPPDAEPWRLGTDDHLDAFCGRTAADWIRAWSGDAPLYLQVNFPGPHKPFDPTTEFLDLYDPDDPQMPLPVLVPPQPPIAPLVQTYLGPKFEDWDEAGARALRAHYYGKVSLVDRYVGEVLQALKDAGLYDDAWVIFHSDHGELVADHSMTGKVLAYEGAIRVPLMIKPPGGVTGWEDAGQVDQMDVTATLVALAGLDPTGMGDRPLVDRVLGGPDGPEAGTHKPVLFENLGAASIRDGRYKLSWDLATGVPVELYDLQTDPSEITNRVLDPEVRAEVDRLVDVLRSLRPLPVDNWET